LVIESLRSEPPAARCDDDLITLRVANNPLERIIREIRRRTRVVGAFPDGKSALMLVAARLRHIASTKWGKRRYLVMETLLNPAKQEAAA
jgi:putative transposase